MKIQGCRAFVTGANRGIGAALVRRLSARGAARIYAAARDPSQMRHPAGSAEIIPVQLDVTDPGQCEAAARLASDAALLINNAGVSHFGVTLLDAQAAGALRLEMEVNVFGVLNVSRAFASALEANGGGALVNILSAAALMNVPLLGGYSMSKAAALSLTQSLRALLAAQKTLVAAAIIGSVDTRMARDVPGNVNKVSPDFAADAVLDGIEAGLEEIYTDPMAADMRDRLASDPKKLERYLARGLQMTGKP